MSTLPTPLPAVKPSPKPRKSKLSTLAPTDATDLTDAIHALNDEICYVSDLDRVAILPSSRNPKLNLVTFDALVHSVYANRRVAGISVADEWRLWTKRREVSAIVYEPGKPPFTREGNYNEWRPSGLTPKPGDLALWNRYLDHIFSTDHTYHDWFMAWLAYPLQYPGTKLHTACLFWSTETGTGKSTMGYILKHLYGAHNYTLLRDADLMGNFNAWAARRQTVEAEEIRGGANARKTADTMKSMITQHEIRVNEKHKAHYIIRDCINYYFTSNHADALYLDSSDRRFFVHAVPNKKLPDSFFETELDPWLKSGGFAAILDYLLKIDLTKPIIGGNANSLDPAPFKRGGAAPQTSARRAMILESMDDAESWAHALRHLPDASSATYGHTLFTLDQLHFLYRKSHPSDKLGNQALTRRFKRALVQVANDSAVEVVREGDKVVRKRMLSINPDHERMTPAQLQVVYAQECEQSGAIVTD